MYSLLRYTPKNAHTKKHFSPRVKSNVIYFVLSVKCEVLRLVGRVWVFVCACLCVYLCLCLCMCTGEGG